MSYFYVFLTIFFTVYGQIIIKWQVSKAGSLPEDVYSKLIFLTSLVFNPWIFSGLIAAFAASVTWMAAMTKLPLGHAYPFVSLSFVLVLILSGIVFNESITPLKILGMLIIMLGVAVGSKG